MYPKYSALKKGSGAWLFLPMAGMAVSVAIPKETAMWNSLPVC